MERWKGMGKGMGSIDSCGEEEGETIDFSNAYYSIWDQGGIVAGAHEQGR